MRYRYQVVTIITPSTPANLQSEIDRFAQNGWEVDHVLDGSAIGDARKLLLLLRQPIEAQR